MGTYTIVGWKDGEIHSLTAIRVNKNGNDGEMRKGTIKVKL